jgi:GDP-4-dehydro-6-deoxy-D-mannose reductase
VGPGQREIFVISSFVKQVVEMEKRGLVRGRLRTGDVSIIRDFIDVRDVVIAYDRLLENGVGGEVYNVCSGIGVSLEEVIGIISEIAGVGIDIDIDATLIRPADNRIMIDSNEKIRSATGWTAAIPLRESLRDTIEYWRGRLE